MRKKAILVLGLLAVFMLTGCGGNSAHSVSIVNVSYDPTREFYEEYNKIFANKWKQENNQEVEVIQSHGGSGKQALEVSNGLEADVVTLALEYDVDAIAKEGLIDDKWITEYPKDSAPYTSTIVFLVRKGNPKNIEDWDDLIREDVGVITPNPKTSGGARWNYLAAWAYGMNQYNEDEEKVKTFMKKLYQNVLVLDSGARGSTTSFVENKQGDVLMAWENEAYLSMEDAQGEFELVYPSISILAQPSVAVVDDVVDYRDTREVATAYLQGLYEEDAQRLAAKNYYRPTNEKILQEYSNVFDLNMELTTISDFGGWDIVQQKHFADGGIFDQIYE